MAQNALPTGLSYPIAATTAQGTFNGTLRIVAFGVQNGALVASGIVSGTVINGATLSAISQAVTVPVAGNLLGNLLCSVTNLLNSGGPLSQIANLLNQILGLLE